MSKRIIYEVKYAKTYHMYKLCSSENLMLEIAKIKLSGTSNKIWLCVLIWSAKCIEFPHLINLTMMTSCFVCLLFLYIQHLIPLTE